MAKVISVNAGSSSLKFQLFEMNDESVIASGVVERIGLEDSVFTIKYEGKKDVKTCPIKDHSIAVEMLLNTLIDKKIVDDMRRVQMIVSVGKQLREQYKLRNRLPLNQLTVAGADLTQYANIIRDELNVKNVVFTSDIATVADAFVYLITPKIGARLGGALKEIIPAVKRGDYEVRDGKLFVGEYELNADEFEKRLTVRDGVTGAALPDNTAAVVLDTEINADLVAEGLANDALRFIQDTRKEIGLDVSDRINMEYNADPALANAIEQHRARIMGDALIKNMSQSDAGVYNTQIEGYNLSISITKA